MYHSPHLKQFASYCIFYYIICYHFSGFYILRDNLVTI